jgi:N4-gp56 family major capsid protein
MPLSTDAGISQRTLTYAAVGMLKHAEPVMVLDKLALTKPMPKNKGVEMKFRRPVPFLASTTPLVEGVTPDATSFSYEDVTVNLSQYGDWSNFTDVIADTHEDPVIQDMQGMHGENIGRTMEALNYGVVKGGLNVFYATGSSRASTANTITLRKQRAITRALKKQKGMKITSVLDGSVKYGSRSVEAAYVAVGHTDLESDIRQMPGFTNTSDYGTRSTISPHEIGMVEDVRYILSPDLEPWLAAGAAVGSTGLVATDDTNVDVYPIIYFAKESWATVPLRASAGGGSPVSPTLIPVGKPTKDDPLGQRGVMGWKTWWAAVILNDAWMARLEVGVSELND